MEVSLYNHPFHPLPRGKQQEKEVLLSESSDREIVTVLHLDPSDREGSGDGLRYEDFDRCSTP